ncbi:manganese efflux pump MntP family protein [Vibrio sp. 99-8-1]|uniref:manganese efflux pump MntP n=1 Tax=Vibrio sp. 99-8-1 TaxID=2607602 RepID=UPI0014939AD7|nr:manganese efflux pump MntP family protein [Vibrio sp. 99-8-1]NOI64613.1 manganese efflux pump [Vibrio sp. 99-8-1]
MNIFALIVLAFAMSTDAFAAAIGKGVKIKSPRFIDALKLGVIFGIVEATTPVIGWLIGRSASHLIEAWDHWIALILLTGLGVHMIYQSLKPSEDEAAPTKKMSLALVVLTALGTSTDAMAVGVSLAFIEVNIVLAAGLIGAATFTMVTIGIMLGSALGSLIGRRAETFGGIVLIGVGLWIFYSHVS